MGILLVIVSVLNNRYAKEETTESSAAQIFLIFLFGGSYSYAWTPLTFIYPIEVLSYSLRANGLSVFNGVCSIAAFFNTYAIPYAMRWSSWGFYLITAIWVLVIENAIIWYYFPETSGKSLEEIDEIFDGQRHADTNTSIWEILM